MCGIRKCGCHPHSGHHSPHSCSCNHSHHHHSQCGCEHGSGFTVKCECHGHHHTGHECSCHCECHTENKKHYHHTSAAETCEEEEKIDKTVQIKDLKAHLASLTKELSTLQNRLEKLEVEGECENPEKLEREPGDCSSEQIEECHGDEKDHSCTD